jgi:hypothetical protein
MSPVCGLVEISTSTSTSTWVICSRNIHFADTVKSVCVNQPTQSEHLQLKLNKQTVLYRLKIRFPHYIRYSHNPFWDSKPELFSDISCLRIPYQPCIVLFGKFVQVPPPRTDVNYACTSMSCQPAPEYSKVDIFCCINM